MGKKHISDTHYGDDTILGYENRPFSNVQKMDDAMTEGILKTMAPGDVLIHHGDLGDPQKLMQVFPRFRFEMWLVRGNHDKMPDDFYRKIGFTRIYDKPFIDDDFFINSHDPMYVSRNMPYANIFGHIHGSPMYTNVSARSFCACVERTGYVPIDQDEIVRQMKSLDPGDAGIKEHPGKEDFIKEFGKSGLVPTEKDIQEAANELALRKLVKMLNIERELLPSAVKATIERKEKK